MKLIKISILLFLILILVWCSNWISSATEKIDFYKGVDISILPKIETHGGIFREKGNAKDALHIFKNNNINCIRLRLFHTPNDEGPVCNSLDYTLRFAKRIKESNLQFMLDFHYSDTWADPGKQYIPKAWEGMSHTELAQAVFEYTRDTIVAFREAGVLPDMVQPGNEIIHGMLWPVGKLPDNWDNFAELVKAGINGVEAGRDNAPRPLIMIHIDRGGDKKRTKVFFT